MKNAKFSLLASTLVMLAGGLVGCQSEVKTETVRIGFHDNLGPSAGMTAVTEGYFKEQGINPEYSIATGPNCAASLIAGNLDVSFMGNGVAWNYFSDNSKIKLVALDNLTDDDRLIATKTGRGKNLTITSTANDLIAALKGSKVALDMTATPKSFFNSLITELNKGKENNVKIWYEDTEGKKFPDGLADAEYVAGNKLTIVNVQNANLTSSMTGDGAPDFCVAFAPIATTLEKETTKYTVVAKTSTHLSEAYTPSTWAVNIDFLTKHEETFKKFMTALVKGMNKRAESPETAAKALETISAQPGRAEKTATDVAKWLTAQDQLDLCEKSDGKGYKYVENIRNSQDQNNVKKTVQEATDFSYIVEAAKALLKK